MMWYLPSTLLYEKSDKKENQPKNISQDTPWKYLPTSIFSMVALLEIFKVFLLNNKPPSAGLLWKLNSQALFIIILIL